MGWILQRGWSTQAIQSPVLRQDFIALLFVVFFAFAFSPTLSSAQQPTIPKPPKSLRNLFKGTPPKTTDELKAMQDHVLRLAEAVRACTVSVQDGMAHGSGVIINDEGYILTVAHVVGKPGKPVTVRFSDGRIARGYSLGMHLELDAGLIKLNGDGPWPYLKMAKNDQIMSGQWCAAAGHPGGHDAARGAVFRLGRILTVEDFIRTDCQLVGGDSGGPLVNMYGEVIGIHSRIGISVVNNLHVPISIYRRNWEDLVNGKLWQSRSYIGVRGVKDAKQAVVSRVHPGSPAESAGLRVGDIVTKFDGYRIHEFRELVRLVREQQPGETVTLQYERNGKKQNVEVTIATRN